jgi:uridine kinase
VSVRFVIGIAGGSGSGASTLARRILRDTIERGRDVAGIVAQCRRTARPSHDVHIEPSKRHAHLIVPMDAHHEPGPAVAVLEATIASVAQRRAT